MPTIDKPVLDRVLRKAHAELKKEIMNTVEFIRQCQKPFPADLAKHRRYINDRRQGGKYHSQKRNEAHEQLLRLDNEAHALHELAYFQKIKLEHIRGIELLV